MKPPTKPTTKTVGDQGESRALRYLTTQGLSVVHRNYRTPGRGGGEIDLIMQSPDGTLVFVEVRARSSLDYGGAAASIGHVKRRRAIFAAQHFLLRYGAKLPPCRFDVIALDGDQLEWIQAAFDAS